MYDKFTYNNIPVIPILVSDEYCQKLYRRPDLWLKAASRILVGSTLYAIKVMVSCWVGLSFWVVYLYAKGMLQLPDFSPEVAALMINKFLILAYAALLTDVTIKVIFFRFDIYFGRGNPYEEELYQELSKMHFPPHVVGVGKFFVTAEGEVVYLHGNEDGDKVPGKAV
ncbi:hypothetical protein NEIMUCOT_03757 [Neisseria mucosa ATCC 25996]|jgi:hypothetical protein|uniref:Uncharacterized protein n=1 Tax=Neisseria mucosa (strain ATCC 25996 / DSM 4631 / NCTC 10774 / M26) TaxID=546266 RepID=D2ZT24_NEIM2|nr:hypothetical protein [Neisseria mucosa]EFC89957.1 hypothetical protein NEIMUCOT_03757 [Neisseria mucosa ATCC 25996]SUA37323.1 Uncharacterised protein [Neisseria mucosa]